MSERVKLRVVWGESEDSRVTTDYDFNTEAERTEFLNGANEASGWMSFQSLLPNPDGTFPEAEDYNADAEDEDMEAQGHQYEVIVSNIGKVYEGPDVIMARQHYDEYVELSKFKAGRASNENVTMMKDGEIIGEHEGKETI